MGHPPVKRPLRSVLLRERLFHDVLELRKSGLSYNRIIAEVQQKRGVLLRKSHISGWVNGKHRPFGSVRLLDTTPTSELAYIIGVYYGDGSASVTHYNYKIKLQVIDKDFAEEFARCLSVVLRRRPPHVRWDKKHEAWYTEVSSLLLYKLLLTPLGELRKTIEHCVQCKAAFLRGFYDSEGSMWERSLTVCNSDLQTLRLVIALLADLGVENTGIRLLSEGGHMKIIKGIPRHQNLNHYGVYVRRRSLDRFQEAVGFTIQRKMVALDQAVTRVHRNGSRLNIS